MQDLIALCGNDGADGRDPVIVRRIVGAGIRLFEFQTRGRRHHVGGESRKIRKHFFAVHFGTVVDGKDERAARRIDADRVDGLRKFIFQRIRGVDLRDRLAAEFDFARNVRILLQIVQNVAREQTFKL